MWTIIGTLPKVDIEYRMPAPRIQKIKAANKGGIQATNSRATNNPNPHPTNMGTTGATSKGKLALRLLNVRFKTGQPSMLIYWILAQYTELLENSDRLE
jgi:hypothetical protein